MLVGGTLLRHLTRVLFCAASLALQQDSYHLHSDISASSQRGEQIQSPSPSEIASHAQKPSPANGGVMACQVG